MSVSYMYIFTCLKILKHRLLWRKCINFLRCLAVLDKLFLYVGDEATSCFMARLSVKNTITTALCDVVVKNNIGNSLARE